MWLKWILTFLVTLPAWGYRFTADLNDGFYWASLPINIAVVESDPNRKSLLEDLAKAAIMEWEDRTGLSLWDYKGSGTKNIIRWSNKFASETQMDPASVLAVAIRYTNGPYFAKTEIIINGSHPYNQDANYLRTTITHELGHTMGLDHSEVAQAVMAPSLQPWYSGLHDDDVSGMSAVHAEINHRQVTGYISPLAYSQNEETQEPLSCGTTIPVGAQPLNLNGALSLSGGILISFVRKLIKWFKSLL